MHLPKHNKIELHL